MLSALEKLSERKREDYETALPEIGAIVAMVEVERVARENRSQIKRSERLARWKCPNCNSTFCGFPTSTDDLFRKCYKRILNSDGQSMLCGGAMVVIFDDEASVSGEQVEFKTPAWMSR